MVKTILVTGANSFIGCWIVKYLVEKGYNVRGTVRSKEKESEVLDGIDEKYSNQISFVYINDITNDSFDQAVQNVNGIIHVASPFHFKAKDPEKDLLLPAIRGTIGVLQSAHKYNNENNEKKIKRIVITSSFASIVDGSLGFRPGYIYTENDWSPLTYEQGVAAKDDPVTAYRASKVCAERAAWEFIEKEKPEFTIATICEPTVFGPRLAGFKSFDHINTSNSSIWPFITSGKDGQIPVTLAFTQVDVRDVAYTHIAALEKTIDTNERFVIAQGCWSYQQVADLIHESDIIPQSIKDTTPIGIKGQQLPDHYLIDTSKAQKLLDVTFIPFNKTMQDLILELYKLSTNSINQN
jgi:nucleoside-diphosphate-sugar epimerase